ncbi:MAG TPA: nitroreductase family protein [Burkholderiaceae bacterium]|nr:nitroreductase family protein [Burkholderiaceae bacterium]
MTTPWTVTRRTVNAALLAANALAVLPGTALAQALRTLPPARKEIGKPLMQALQARRSTRIFDARALPEQVLSDLLWAAYGVNRPSGDRTAPYWRHLMVIDVYAVMADGAWRYEPAAHTLHRQVAADVRGRTGLQGFVGYAPLNLVYVVHGERMTDVSAEERRLYGSVDAAFAGQNVYLYCASEGLATVFRAEIDYTRLAQALQLPDGQFVAFSQTVGYPGV